MLFSTAGSLVSEKDKNLTFNFSFFVNNFFFNCAHKVKQKDHSNCKNPKHCSGFCDCIVIQKTFFSPLTHHTSTSCTSTNKTFPRIHSGQCIHDVTVPLSLNYEIMAMIYIMIYILHINTSDDGYFMLLSSVVCSEQQ